MRDRSEMADDADQALLERARAGDGQALERLLERHQPQIYRFAMKMCGDPENAKDVAQETLIAMARGVRDFRGASSLSTWLYTIARSFCIKQHRRRAGAPDELGSLERDAAPEARRLADPGGAPDEALASRQLERALARALAALDPPYREVLVLRDVEGLTAPEVAEVLGVTVQAVKSRLHRARVAVRAELAPLFGDAAGGGDAAAGTCPDVLTLFSQHLEDEISAEVCSEMERHLAGCVRCRGACDSLRRTLALCHQTGRAAPVPPALQASVKVALQNFLTDAKP